MDALALLCNLHADGPLTLQRLRRLGCESIGQVLVLDTVRLGQELDRDAAAAERFQREGRFLLERLEGERPPAPGGAEWRAAGPAPATSVPAGPPAPAGVPDARLSAGGAGVSGPAAPATAGGVGVGQVLAAWRSLDRDDPPQAPTAYAPPRPELPGDAPLVEGLLDGLGASLVDELEGVGVATLRGLVEADAMELADDLALGVTRVLRLQFLARRALAATAGVPAPLARPSVEPPAALPRPPAESPQATLRPSVSPTVRAFQTEARPHDPSMSEQETRALWGTGTELAPGAAGAPEAPPADAPAPPAADALEPRPPAPASSPRASSPGTSAESGFAFGARSPEPLPTIQEVLVSAPRPPRSVSSEEGDGARASATGAQEGAAGSLPGDRGDGLSPRTEGEEDAGSSGPFA